MGYSSLGVTVAGGFLIPVASGSQPPALDPNAVYGDPVKDPLVQYMSAVRPGVFNQPPGQPFLDAVRYSLTEMEYQGQPVDIVLKSCFAAASALADTYVQPTDDHPDVSTLRVMTQNIVYNQLKPIAASVAAMPPVPKQQAATPGMNLHFNFSPAQVKCMQVKGATWDVKSGTCKMPAVRYGTVIPSSPSAPASGIPTWAYVVGGVAVLGVAAFFLKA